jgi:hypothetical protein
MVLAPGRDSGTSVVTFGHEKEGGAAGYFLCERCNNDAGTWYDPAYGDLWHHLARRLLVEEHMPPQGGPYPLEVNGVDPGAIVRCVLSGMMALNPLLRAQFPDLQPAVEKRRPIAPPEGLHLLLALNPDRQLRVAGGGAQRQEIRSGQLIRVVYVYAEFAWCPLYLVLTDHSGRDYWSAAQDILPWMRDRPGATRTVDLLVPVLGHDQLHTHEIHNGANRAIAVGPTAEPPFGQVDARRRRSQTVVKLKRC